VLFVGDNGAVGSRLQPPRLTTHGKGTVYEGGVRVPLIVAGQSVAASAMGQESGGLVQATDLFPTVLEIAGLVPPGRKDAVSMLPYLSDPTTSPRREVIYAEVFSPNGDPMHRIEPAMHDRAARTSRYKVVRNGLAPDEFYDLQLDPYELSPLDLASLTPQQQEVYEGLVSAIENRYTEPSIPSLSFTALAALGSLVLGVAFAAQRYRASQSPLPSSSR